MAIRKEYYTPQIHNRLLMYMRQVFPHRTSDYLEWWLEGMRNGGESLWNKGIILFDEDEIVGCTTALPCRLIAGGDSIENCFWRGNTIVSDSYRGMGLSKMLYSEMNDYNCWFSVGITNIAWKIQPRYVENFHPLKPVLVYVGLSSYMPLIKRKRKFGNSIRMDMNYQLIRVSSVNDIVFPANGRWTTDQYEFVRDVSFLESRFFNIYRSSQYAIYRLDKGGKGVGYFVVRPILYKKVKMLSIVDFRILDENYSLVLKVSRAISKAFGLRLFILLTNLVYPVVSFAPFVVRTSKQLHCATSFEDRTISEALITSADSDLDFVYF